MFTSQALLCQTKIDTQDFTSFLQQTGYIHQERSGVYHLNTLGHLALQRIERRAQLVMENNGCCQWLMSALQSQANWDKTGRAADYGDELMSVRLRNGQTMRLAATAEEQITAAVVGALKGRHANHWFYQINTKWRDEMRARNGLVRAREFRMLDAYSFDNTIDAMMERFEKGKRALLELLHELGCCTRVVPSDCGEIGGLMSEEIQVQTSLEEEGWLEVGHCFALGQKYSQAFGLKLANVQNAWMSCHGLGTTRLLAVLLNARKTGTKLVGDENFCVVDNVVVCLSKNQEAFERTHHLYQHLKDIGETVVWEDRFERAGQLLAASEMLGARTRWVVSARLGQAVETTQLATGETTVVRCEDVFSGRQNVLK